MHFHHRTAKLVGIPSGTQKEFHRHSATTQGADFSPLHIDTRLRSRPSQAVRDSQRTHWRLSDTVPVARGPQTN
jgi:hypothetical protein